MTHSMNRRSDAVPELELLVAIDAAEASLRIWGDGSGTILLNGTEVAFGREIGRFALRRLYLGAWGGETRGLRTIEMMSDELDGCQTCSRSDCRKPIPESRRLNAFERGTPAKYCSKTCQCTEATRRWRNRRVA